MRTPPPRSAPASGGAGDSAPKPSSRRCGAERPARDFAFASAIGARRKRKRPPQHFDEQTRKRQVRPIRPGADVKQHDQPAPARRAVTSGRVVGQRSPTLALRCSDAGSASTCRRTTHVARRREAGERGIHCGNAPMRQRRLPGQRAAEASASRGAGAPAAESSLRWQGADRQSAPAGRRARAIARMRGAVGRRDAGWRPAGSAPARARRSIRATPPRCKLA